MRSTKLVSDHSGSADFIPALDPEQNQRHLCPRNPATISATPMLMSVYRAALTAHAARMSHVGMPCFPRIIACDPQPLHDARAALPPTPRTRSYHERRWYQRF